MENKCLVCGAIIPEGRQVCPTCKKGGKHEISKKLTAKEIIKAYFEDCNEDFCHTCPLSETDCCAEILDLIHRLQDENKVLGKVIGFSKRKSKNKEFLETIDKQKAEIERLTKQLEDMEEQRDRQAYIAEDLIQEKHRWTKQAAKDTAKEIWDDITSYYFSLRVLGNATVELDKLAEFWYKRGVEVE